MAEYHITYEEIAKIVDGAILNAEKQDNLRLYQPAIMAAITGDFEQDNRKEIPEMITLWENMIGDQSQLLLGTRYIRIQGTMIELIKLSLTSGFVDAVISYTLGNPIGLGVSTIFAVVFALYDIWGKASKLEDDDFCVYMQAVSHFHEFTEFTEDDMLGWFPHGERSICNMHNSTWRCDYLGENDICTIDKEKIRNALRSLKSKNILDKEKGDDGKYMFCFKK